MKTLSITTCSAALLAALLPAPQGVQAGTAIQRCAAADGTVVYTDRACSTLGAKPVPMSGELLTRIARERSREVGVEAVSLGAAPSIEGTAGRRSPLAGCAKSPTQLAMDLQGSLALRDVNRLAESYHWVGQSHANAQPLLARLERMSRQPLQDIAFFDAQIGPGGMQLADASGGAGAAGIMQLMLGGDAGPQVVDLHVERYAGCYFVRF